MSKHFHHIATAIRQMSQTPADDRTAALPPPRGLTAPYFQRVFKRYVGVSPHQFRACLALADVKARLLAGERILPASWDAGLSGSGRTHDLFITFEAMTPKQFQQHGDGMTIRIGKAATPFGAVLVAATSRGVCALHFISDDAKQDSKQVQQTVAKRWARARFVADDAQAARYAAKIFGGGNAAARAPLHVCGTNFQINVWRALLAIPAGQVVSYSALAKALTASASGARAVASAAAQNPIAYAIPCHRLLASNGQLQGYAWGVARKRQLLAAEFARNAK